MDKIIIRNYDEIHEKIMNIAHAAEANDFKPDIVAGVSRGGLIPGVVLSHYFDVEFVSLKVSLRDHRDYEVSDYLLGQISNGKKVLIVDDLLDSGATMGLIDADYVRETEGDVRLGVVYYRESSKLESLVDYIGGRLYNDIWIQFPWEFK